MRSARVKAGRKARAFICFSSFAAMQFPSYEFSLPLLRDDISPFDFVSYDAFSALQFSRITYYRNVLKVYSPTRSSVFRLVFSPAAFTPHSVTAIHCTVTRIDYVLSPGIVSTYRPSAESPQSFNKKLNADHYNNRYITTKTYVFFFFFLGFDKPLSYEHFIPALEHHNGGIGGGGGSDDDYDEGYDESQRVPVTYSMKELPGLALQMTGSVLSEFGKPAEVNAEATTKNAERKVVGTQHEK